MKNSPTRVTLFVSLLITLMALGGVWNYQEFLSVKDRTGLPNNSDQLIPNVTTSPLSKPDASTQARISENYGKLPLSFEGNQGQTDSQVKFLSRGNGYTLFLTPTEAVLSLCKPVADNLRRDSRLNSNDIGLNAAKQQRATMRMKLSGANPNPEIKGLEELPGKSRYFIGDDPRMWRKNVPSYTKVCYENVYPGINLIYYGNQGQFEYDFIISPGANTNSIELHFEGIEGLKTDTQGNLILQTSLGEMLHRKPIASQTISGVTHFIDTHYELVGDNRVIFKVKDYDVNTSLVIDPIISFSTLLGGSSLETGGQSIAVDSSGNMYMVGHTRSIDFPLAAAFQTDLSGETDVYIAKFNSTGTALLFATYYGGSGNDLPTSIAVDSSGNCYIAGRTTSNNLPVVNPLQPNYGGGVVDAFFAKIDSAASTLLYSTYLGGSQGDEAEVVLVDATQNVFVSGVTSSSEFPTTPGAFQTTLARSETTLAGSADVFVTKFNSTLTELVYSTFIGGGSGERALDAAVDNDGNLYLTGVTFVRPSNNYPKTYDAFPQTTTSLFQEDVFVTKLNSTGSSLVYSTYFGGQNRDSANSIAVDGSGNVYITGDTSSPAFPVLNALQPTLYEPEGDLDAFVIKLNQLGAPVFSTFLGGNSADRGLGIAVDSSERIYLSGETFATNFPNVRPIQGSCNSCINFNGNLFVTRLSSSGTAIDYSFLLGGSNRELTGQSNIALDGSGNLYVVGGTNSTDFPLVNAIQQTLAGDFDSFVVKIDVSNSLPAAFCRDIIKQADSNCQANVNFGEVDNGSFDPDGTSINLSLQPIGPYPLGETIVTLTVTDADGASSTCTATITVIDTTPPTVGCPPNQTLSATSASGSIVNYSSPTVADNCSGATVMCSPPSGSAFPIGNTTVLCTAIDVASNTTNCSFIVTVLPGLSVNDVIVIEGNNGFTDAVFTVGLAFSSNVDVTVNYATADNTAIASDDYVTKTGTLTIPAGVISQSVTISIRGETLFESDETFFINLSAPVNALIVDGQGVGTITNDDQAAADLAINKVASARSIPTNANVTYTITATNTGPDSADGVIVSDNIPAGTAFVSAITTMGTLTTPAPGGGGIVTCNIPSLPNGANVTITLTVQVIAPAGTKIDNTANVSSSTSDPRNNNNSDTVSISVSRR